MAEGGSSSDNSWESWLGGWVQTAKEKSSSALEFVKRDLAEFTCTMQQETEKAMEKTSSSLTKEKTEQATNKFKAGISSFFDNISKALVIPPDDDYVPMQVSADGTSLYDRGKARLHALQLDASTYLDPPRGPEEQYNMWVESFDMEQHKGEISEVLVSKVEVRAFYTKLVPNEVSHADFWQRYFFRVHQLQCDEARKQALMQRAEQSRGDSLSWEDDWSGGEEDDGNQSDWEKIPRPPQSASAAEASTKQSKELPTESFSSNSNFSPQETNAEVEKLSPEVQNDTDKDHTSTSHISVHENIPESSVSNIQSNSNTSSSAQAEIHCLPENASLSATVQSDEDSSCSSAHPSQSPAELWNLHIPLDTACASHPEVDNEGREGEACTEPGSSNIHYDEPSRSVGGDMRQTEDAFIGAAAAGVELPSLNDVLENPTAADAACGAADTVDSCPPQLSDNPDSNLDIPAASSSSGLESQKAVSDTNSETFTTTKADSHNSASSPMSDISKDSTETKREEVMKPAASDYTDLSVDTQSSAVMVDEIPPEIGMRIKGDMVVVGERGSPSTESSDTKDLALDEDWEQDFDVEVTEEDLKAAEDIAKKLGENLDAEDDDWENWE